MFEGNAVRRIDVRVQRQSRMVPDALAVNARPVGKDDSEARPKGVTVSSVGFTYIGAAKEPRVGHEAWRGVAIGQPPSAMQVGIIHLLHIGLAAAAERKYFALLLTLRIVRDVLCGRGEGLPRECPAIHYSGSIVETTGAIKRIEIFAIRINDAHVRKLAQVAIHSS